MAARRAERGFTLLELLVVLMIVGVLSAMVLPMMKAGSRQAEVRRSVRAFISAARQASASAVRERRPVALVVWPNDGEFGVDRHVATLIVAAEPERHAVHALAAGRQLRIHDVELREIVRILRRDPACGDREQRDDDEDREAQEREP